MTSEKGTMMLEELQEPARELRLRFERTIDVCRPQLWRFCLKLTGSPWEAEDLVQETVLKALAKLHRFGQALEPRSYLFRIASNTWIDQCRRSRPVTDLEGIEDDLPSDAAGIRADVGLSAMQEVLRMLPPRQRVVYLLSEGFEFTPAEIAAMLRVTEGAVKAMLHRARVAVRRATSDAEKVPDRTVPAVSPVLQAYLDAFNRRDVDALAALFDRDATTEIVGDWEEHGVETMRKYSLAFWAAEEVIERADVGRVGDRTAVLVFRRQPDGTEALSSVVALEIVENRITSQRWYFFCPELLDHFGREVGVSALDHGYRYEPAVTD